MKLKEIKSQFTLGHIGLITFAVFALGGLLVFQNWKTVKGMFDDNNTAQVEQGTGLYYAYQAPAIPEVLGADTIPDGPSVINEDGSITPLSSFGDVLGASTETTAVDWQSIKVKTTASNFENMRAYLDSSFLIEAAILPGEFEAALVSGDETKTQAQIEIFHNIENQLSAMTVPDSMKKIQQLKIAQYRTATSLLQNYKLADDNPGMVSEQLSQFMEIQKLQDEEMQKIFRDNPQL